MNWNIADAKQQFSEVVRLSAEEPQAIYNRNTPVAALINASEFERFQAWLAAQATPDLLAQFDELRQALGEAGLRDIPAVRRTSLERPNAFLEMIEEEARPKQARPLRASARQPATPKKA